MTTEQIKELCCRKQEELIEKYFSNIVREAAIERPETIGEYTRDLPLKIESEYRAFLEKLWKDNAPETLKGTTLILEEQKLRELMTGSYVEEIDAAYDKAVRRTVLERITDSNHKDVSYYKGLLKAYTGELLSLMRQDFLEEITGEYIGNKAFEED